MNDEEILEKMKVIVEEIIKDKMKENISNISANDKKNVTKSIINELNKVIDNEIS